jgi:hypothetical protein
LTSTKKARPQRGNYISEWFGHRLYPTVVETAQARADQRNERCPFLSAAVAGSRACVKSQASRGVCTIDSASNGHRQDWLVCPYRALSPDLIGDAISTLFGPGPGDRPRVLPAVMLSDGAVRAEVAAKLADNERVFVYFDAKLGGELSLPQTARSPELSFDVTLIELLQRDAAPQVGRFGILEIQTMDFHGSYRAAVRNLREALRMHEDRFGETVQAYPHWLSEGVEGPNIANVFKRTFYQMMFKFQLGQHERCCGCVLAIPQSVWDSWQKHLGQPELEHLEDDRYRLSVPAWNGEPASPAWIFVFDTDLQAGQTPTPLRMLKRIRTDASSLGHWALDIAPRAALQPSLAF